MGLEWAKVVGDKALEIKKRQNKAAYIGCVMTIGVAVSVHGSSFMETTDHLPWHVVERQHQLRACWYIGKYGAVHFAVSVNDSSTKESTDTSGTDMDYMALYVSNAPIAPLAIAMNNVDGNHKFAPSEILEIFRAGLETAAGATGVAQGFDAIVEAGHKWVGEDPEGKDPEAVADMTIADSKEYVLPTPGGVAMFDVLNTTSNVRMVVREAGKTHYFAESTPVTLAGRCCETSCQYAPIAPIAVLAIAMTNVEGNHKFAPSEILEIVRAGSETAAVATGAAQGIDAIVETGHKTAGEDSSEGGSKMKELAEAYGYERKDPEVVHVLLPPGGVAMFDVQVSPEEDLERYQLFRKSCTESGTRELRKKFVWRKIAARPGQRRPRTQGKAGGLLTWGWFMRSEAYCC